MTTPQSFNPGLPWPAEYADLEPLIRAQWEIEGEIFLNRQLSGKSGAFVYAADLTCRGFAGQAILKLDAEPDPTLGEADEAARHLRALELAPDYGETHLPRVVHTLQHGGQVAILSTIAGRGLIYATPWQLCPHGQQLDAARRVSRGLLEDWNAGYRLTDGMLGPQDLLRRWLGTRLDPQIGKLFGFLSSRCGIAPDEPSVIFGGSWYPNPLAFALSQSDTMDRLHLRAVFGNVHCDLNGYNVLVGGRHPGDESYYLIDLAQYEPDQFLFLDSEYLAFSHLLESRHEADASRWEFLLKDICDRNHSQKGGATIGDDLGLAEIVHAMRQEVMAWVDRHEAHRLSFLENQLMLAGVAVGLNFASKGIDDRLRRIGFLYAAARLRSFMEMHGLDWPKHGPAFSFEASETTAEGSSLAHSGLGHDHHDVDDKATIAVLAFENLSGGPEQEYFADGMTEEISNILSQSDWLMVISRGSTFAYKGRNATAQQIGRELGVHYIVEGTVQKSGDKVRVTAQLTDAVNGHRLWSERYHRDLNDIFAVQEEIAQSIGTTLDMELKIAEIQHAHRKSRNLGVWDMFQRGMWHFFKFTDDDSDAAQEQFTKLTDQFPGYAPAMAALSLLETREIFMGDRADHDQLIERAHRYAAGAIAADDRNSHARVALARVLLLQGQHEQALEEAQAALELNPSSSGARLTMAQALLWAGRPEEALPEIDMSLRLSPKGPLRDLKLLARSTALYALDRLDEAEDAARRVANGHRIRHGGLLLLAATLARQGRLDEAADAVEALREARPRLTLSRLLDNWTGMSPAFGEKLTDDLRAAGLPD